MFSLSYGSAGIEKHFSVPRWALTEDHPLNERTFNSIMVLNHRFIESICINVLKLFPVTSKFIVMGQNVTTVHGACAFIISGAAREKRSKIKKKRYMWLKKQKNKRNSVSCF